MKDHLDLITYQQLTEQIPAFTESEANLHAFIVSHFEELSYYGIIDLAQKAQVSKATIGRYLNKLGFTGYAAFKNALKRELITNTIVAPIEAHKSKIIDQASDSTTESQRYIGNVMQLISQFSQELNMKDLDTLVHRITQKSRNIYVVGPASSRSLALHFTTLLKYNRSNVVLLPLDKGELPKAMLGITDQDLLIAFSYYRFNPVVLDISKYFNNKHAYVALVTNTHSNPYGLYTNVQFVLPSDADSIFHSRTIGFLFVELLLFLVQRNSLSNDNFEELESLFKFFGTFSSLEFK